MASERVTLLATIDVTPGKEERAEELWRVLADDITSTEQGRVKFQLLRQAEGGQYIGIYEFASERVRDEFLAKETHVAVGKMVKEEGIAAKEPEMGTGIRWLKAVMGSE